MPLFRNSSTTSALYSGVKCLAYTYDDFLRVASRTVGGSTAAYTYDADGLYTGTTSPTAFTVQHDLGGKNGLLAGTTLGSVSDAWTIDGFGEPTGYTAQFGSTPLYAMSGVKRDAAGRVTAMTEKVGTTTHTWSFSYDELGDLAGATYDGTAHTWTFDPNGNRTAADGAAQGPYDAQDRLVDDAHTYTANGDLASTTNGSGTTSYAYDLSGNLRSATLPGGDTVTYVVDGGNRRIGKTRKHGATTATQGFLYDGQLRIAAELDASNAVVSVFVYGTRLNVPDYMVRGGKTYRIVADWRGSVRAVSDVASGKVVETIDYDAWGNVTNLADTTCAGGPACFYVQPFGFAGGLYDKDTGLVRFGARDYDPSVGRWTQKDGSGFGGGTNFYAYAYDDPINWIDLTGNDPVIDFINWSQPATQAIIDFAAALDQMLLEPLAWMAGLDATPLFNYINDALGVSQCSNSYKAGTIAGLALGLLDGETEAQAVEEAAPEFEEGSFSITDWTGYPEGMPRPTGPVRVVTGQEYTAARSLANETNAGIRAEYGLEGSDFQIHEIQPVKFGGSPTDAANKMLLPSADHIGPNGVHQQFWSPLLRWATGSGG